MQDETISKTDNAIALEFPTLKALGTAKNIFGRQLKAARKARNYTQVALGRIIGIDGQTVARIERGEQGVRWDTMERIFELLGQPASFYFSSEQPPAPYRETSPEEALDVLKKFIDAQKKGKGPEV